MRILFFCYLFLTGYFHGHRKLWYAPSGTLVHCSLCVIFGDLITVRFLWRHQNVKDLRNRKANSARKRGHKWISFYCCCLFCCSALINETVSRTARKIEEVKTYERNRWHRMRSVRFIEICFYWAPFGMCWWTKSTMRERHEMILPCQSMDGMLHAVRWGNRWQRKHKS